MGNKKDLLIIILLSTQIDKPNKLYNKVSTFIRFYRTL